MKRKYYILTNDSTREAFGPLSKEDIAELDIPETTLVCIPSQKTGLKPAKDFSELSNLIISVDIK